VPILEDRAFLVPPTSIVTTAWISIDCCVLGNRERLDFAAVERTGRRLLQQGDYGSWPPVNGAWRDDGRFAVHDGRHEYLAALALGRTTIFVAWLTGKG
jgi:hypothetical protein